MARASNRLRPYNGSCRPDGSIILSLNREEFDHLRELLKLKKPKSKDLLDVQKCHADGSIVQNVSGEDFGLLKEMLRTIPEAEDLLKDLEIVHKYPLPRKLNENRGRS